jgi:energy-coupling factor transport system ATP-binding protein
MIELKNVSFAYDKGKPVLNDLSFSLKEGQWVVIVGANGCGKSTLARHLNGLILPDEGEVLVDGLNTADEDALLKIRQKVAFVFQNPDNQIVSTAVEDDIAFGPENLGLPSAEIAQRVEEALRLTAMTPLRKKNPAELSGGEKQRLAIAGALAMGAPYLVLDEPTSMLDPSMRKQVLDILLYLHRQKNKTVIYVTNLMEEVLLGERVLCVAGGFLAADNTPSEIFQNPSLLNDIGLTLPVLNRLALRLADNGFPRLKDALTMAEIEECICGSF